MKRNSTTLFLESPGATTPVPWVNNAPDFSFFTEPTLSVLQNSWQAFLDSGEQLEVIPDPEPPPPDPDWMGFKTDYKSSPTIRAWFAGLDPMDREDLAAMVAAQSINGLTAAMADVDYSAVKSELNDLLALHNIGLTLP